MAITICCHLSCLPPNHVATCPCAATQYESKGLEVYQLSPGYKANGQNISSMSHFYYIESNIVDLFEAYGVRAHMPVAYL